MSAPHRAPSPLASDRDEARRDHHDLDTLDLDDLEHELCIAIVALGLDERRRDVERPWWLERLRRVRETLRGRR